MRITVDSTPTITRVDIGGQVVPARVWLGATDGGVPVAAFITRIAPETHDPAALAQFQAELGRPTPPGIVPAALPGSIDPVRAEAAVAALGAALLQLREGGEDDVGVLLNALAGVTAMVLQGAGESAEAREFFELALAQNLFRWD